MRRQRHVLTQVPQELTVDALKRPRLTACDHQHSEHATLEAQWGKDNRVQTAARATLWKRKRQRSCVGFVNQLARNAPAESVRIDRHCHLLLELKSAGERAARRTDRGDRQKGRVSVVQTQAAEVDRQLILEA